MTDTALALLIGFALDLAVGDPEWFPHPVRLIGQWISFAERLLRRRCKNLRRGAVWLTLSTVALAMALTAFLLFAAGRAGRAAHLTVSSLLVWMGLSAKCLADEAKGVQKALSLSLVEGRRRVARIVGRETARLTEDEIICATVETVAENTTDGVIAPLFYALLGGPVLMMGFKAASTLDSMVGYMDDRYRDIGWSSARLDDILCYIPARITAFLMVAAAALPGFDAKRAFMTVLRDHSKHKSPNCAWSEAAAAGALGIRLGGTHVYHRQTVEKPHIGDSLRAPQREDIGKACTLLYAASALGVLLCCAAGLLAR